MENVAVGERVFLTETVLPLGIDQVEHVVAVLQVHREAFQAIGNFARNRLAFQTAHLLEVRELRDFHAVHPNFPAQAPGAERRVFPVVFHEADVVHRSVDTQRAKAAQIQVNNVDGRGLEHNLILVMLMQAVGVFAVAGVLRTTGRLHVSGTPRFGTEGTQERGRVRGASPDFDVNRLQQGAALFVPILLQTQDHFLKGNHGSKKLKRPVST